MMMFSGRFQTISTASLLVSLFVTQVSTVESLEILDVKDAPRKLEDNADFQYDLSEFSIRFEKCQFVKMFDDELAEDGNSDSPFALKHFVVYRLCPSQTCTMSSSKNGDTCGDVYGTYTMDVEDYLYATINYQKDQFDYMCQNCDEQCNDNGEYCSGCGKTCYRYQNLEASGYVDAANYVQCQQLQMDGDDNGQVQYYIGPRCSNAGTSITVGLFSDENCYEPVDDVAVEDVLGAKLSYHLVAHTYSNDESICLSCKEGEDGNVNEQDQYDGDDVNEMCEELYKGAAKCESETGLQLGFIQTAREDGEYENQVENEWMACNFINSLIWNSYTEAGEINISDPQDEIIRKVTKNQALSLSFLTLLFVSLIGSMYYFQRKISELTAPTLGAKEGSHFI